ncbi:MAG: hypothetical protein U1F11_02930 [Steroidobacteraceae bacterium]
MSPRWNRSVLPRFARSPGLASRGRAPGRVPRPKASLLLACALLLAVPAARAEPWLAVQMGLKCAQCHVNPTGGGLRSTFGNVFAQNQLAAHRLGGDDAELWTGTIGRFLSVGGNVRATASYVDVPDQGSSNDFQVEEARIYLDLGIIPGRLSVYVDERVAPGNAEDREANVRLWLREGEIYLKGGKFYLPFGWRLEDDNAYVRQLSGINMQAPDQGFELGLEHGPWSAQFAVSNGSAGGPETDDGKMYTLRAERVAGDWRVGLSATVNDTDAGNRKGAALFGGLRRGRFALLGEFDYFDDRGIGRNGRELMASMIEANWLWRQGHNVKLTYEWFEPDVHVDEDEQTRTSLVYEWSPLQFLQARFGVRKFIGIPQNDFQNRTEAFLQLHGFF